PVDDGRLHAPREEDLLEDPAVGRVVVDDEHSHSAKILELPSGGRRLLLPDLERQGHDEPASLADFAFDANLAAHEGDESRGDREPQSRAPVLSCRGRVGLRERIKDLQLLVDGNPDTRVAHHETQVDAITAIGFYVDMD